MLVFTLKRLAGVVPTLFILLTATFLLVHLAPGSPLDGDRPMPAEIRANLEAKYHLDEPLVQQYGRYLLNIAQLDFGASYQYKDTSVNDLIATGFPVSLAVGGFSLLFALVIGIHWGFWRPCARTSRRITGRWGPHWPVSRCPISCSPRS